MLLITSVLPFTNVKLIKVFFLRHKLDFSPYLVADLSHHKTKKRHNSLYYNLLCRYELRRQDLKALYHHL